MDTHAPLDPSVLWLTLGKDNCLSVQDLLCQAGMPEVEVRTVRTAGEGRNALEAGRYHLCLVDAPLLNANPSVLVDLGRLAGHAHVCVVGDAAEYGPEVDVVEPSELTPALLARMVRFATDRSHRSQRMAELEKRLRETHRLEAIGRLSGGIAHEVNNILSVIMANLDLAASHPDLHDSEVIEYLSEMRNVTNKGGTLVRKLLSFGRRDSIDQRVLHLDAAVEDALGLLEHVIREDIRILVDHDGRDCSVYADPDAVHQILVNLATNAKDSMPDGGELHIAIARCELTPEFCGQHPGARPGDYVRLEVRDTGCGIQPDLVKNVFEPFYSTKNGRESRGMGLPTVFGLAKQHGGYVDVSSVAGEGTTVQVYLPFAPGHATEVVAARPLPKNLHGTETILLVEDQLELRRAARKILEQAGYRVIATGDGQDALAVHERYDREIQLVVSDIVLPGLSGRDLFSKIRRRPAPPKFLFTSGYDARHIRGEAIEVQVPLLRKPWTQDELLSAVRAVLEDNYQGHVTGGDRFRRLTSGEVSTPVARTRQPTAT